LCREKSALNGTNLMLVDQGSEFDEVYSREARLYT